MRLGEAQFLRSSCSLGGGDQSDCRTTPPSDFEAPVASTWRKDRFRRWCFPSRAVSHIFTSEADLTCQAAKPSSMPRSDMHAGSDVKHGKRVAPQVLRLHCRR